MDVDVVQQQQTENYTYDARNGTSDRGNEPENIDK